MKHVKTLFFVVFFTHLFSSEVSIDRATVIAQNFYESRSSDVFQISEIQTISNQNFDLIYVFILDPTGFVIISGNDAAMPILGYSFINEYRTESVPIQLEWLFNQYKDEINNLYVNGNSPTSEIEREWNTYSSPFVYEETRSVQPLLSCNWDQGSAWNNMCPEDQNGPGGNVLVGCVAVSMAQVMYYWGYPEVGAGDHSYNHWTYGYQYADFGDSFYDYANMADNYPTEASQLLLYHSGVSVNMGYGVDGSGAQVFGGNPSTYYAMRNYFLFKNSMSQIFPENYSTAVYRAMLQEDLDNNRPIIYVGYSNDGGHAWNIDGYEDDFFHCNWGWGGYQNGNFLLSALNGFNSGQGAIVNIEPQSLSAPNLVMTSSNYYEIEGDGDGAVNPGETVGIEITIDNFVPWEDAQDIELIIEPLSSSNLSVENESVVIDNLNAGQSYSNSNDPFVVSIPSDNTLGSEFLNLHVMAVGSTGELFYENFDIVLNITLNQAGFPLDSDGTVKSSPLVVDLDNDSNMEIIYGDNNGVIHVLDANANPVLTNAFPYTVGDQIWGAVASADIDLDGNLDFIISSKDKHLYAFDQFGFKWAYNADKYLLGTPAIGNLDSDAELEIAVGSYGPGDNYIFAVNHDGTDLANFPFLIDEKIKAGVGLADFNSNQKDDIVFGTDDDNLYVLLDNAEILEGFPFLADDKIQSAPSILELGTEKTIFFGSKDDRLYSISSEGQENFSYLTEGNVYSSPSFINTLDYGPAVFFGSDDGFVYGLNLQGQDLPGWPVHIGNEVVGSILFEDLNGDFTPEVISFSNSEISLNSLNGDSFFQGQISTDLQITSSSIIYDTDSDGDMEIVSGNGMGLLSVDFKELSDPLGTNNNMFRFNNQRTGYISLNEAMLGDLNQDQLLDVLDIVLLINIVLENSEPTIDQMWSADLNSDGVFDVLDIVLLVNAVLLD